MPTSKNAKQLPLLLTVQEVSDILRIHRPKVYVLIKSGTIEAFKLGADWRIKTKSIVNMVGDIDPQILN